MRVNNDRIFIVGWSIPNSYNYIWLLNTFWKRTLFLENYCFLFSEVQCNPPQGLSSPDSQLRADRSGAANPVSGVVPPECCRLLHLLTLLLTLWGECSHICLCVWCDSASGSDNLFHSNNHCSLDECLQRLYLIQISLASSYISLHKICSCNAAFKGTSSSRVSQNATLLFLLKCILSSYSQRHLCSKVTGFVYSFSAKQRLSR